MKKCIHGFGLIEVMLLSVVIAMLLLVSIRHSEQKQTASRIDKAAIEMQQLLNAELAYYTKMNTWGSPANLYIDGYLPDPGNLRRNYITQRDPWGKLYVLSSSGNYLTISMEVPNTANGLYIAKQIVNRLPLAQIDTSTTPHRIVTRVGPPGSNLANANSINFAGLYHHGACVPMPTCPVNKSGSKMKPQIFVVPVSVSGVNDARSQYVYPISSFTAYAKAQNPPGVQPPPCDGASMSPSCNIYGPTNFWRACLSVMTQRGHVSVTNTGVDADAWGQYATIAAFVRCEPEDEAAGSNFNVFSN